MLPLTAIPTAISTLFARNIFSHPRIDLRTSRREEREATQQRNEIRVALKNVKRRITDVCSGVGG